jgi:tetratricopeptide (TPR) repeat protein
MTIIRIKASRLILLVSVVLMIGVWLGLKLPRQSSRPPRQGSESSETSTVLALGDRPVPLPVLKGKKSPVEPHLPAPKLSVQSTQTVVDVAVPVVPLLQQLLNGSLTNKLSRKQLETYLRENKRNAASLLAAARISRDPAFLREALKSFPGDPRVLLDYLMFDKTITDAERRQAIDAFREASPDNALGNYLSALDHFTQGNEDEAVRDMWKSLDQGGMETYWLETMQDVEEAYREAGYSQAQASIAAFGETLLPELQQMMALSRHLRDLQAQYLQNGDSQSAQSIAEIGIRLGTQMQENQGYLVIGDLVGMNIERRVLEGLDPHDVLVVGNQTIGDRLADLNQRKQTIGDIQSVLELLRNLPESEVSAYVARVKLYGELEAIRWLHNKHEAAVAKP